MGCIVCDAVGVDNPDVFDECLRICANCFSVADLSGGGSDHSDNHCPIDTELFFADGRRKYIRGYPGGKRIKL